jgi:hypothetical protein
LFVYKIGEQEEGAGLAWEVGASGRRRWGKSMEG